MTRTARFPTALPESHRSSMAQKAPDDEWITHEYRGQLLPSRARITRINTFGVRLATPLN